VIPHKHSETACRKGRICVEVCLRVPRTESMTFWKWTETRAKSRFWWLVELWISSETLSEPQLDWTAHRDTRAQKQNERSPCCRCGPES